MKKSKFTEYQIIFALRQAETGVKVREVCSKATVVPFSMIKWSPFRLTKTHAASV